MGRFPAHAVRVRYINSMGKRVAHPTTVLHGCHPERSRGVVYWNRFLDSASLGMTSNQKTLLGRTCLQFTFRNFWNILLLPVPHKYLQVLHVHDAIAKRHWADVTKRLICTPVVDEY